MVVDKIPEPEIVQTRRHNANLRHRNTGVSKYSRHLLSILHNEFGFSNPAYALDCFWVNPALRRGVTTGTNRWHAKKQALFHRVFIVEIKPHPVALFLVPIE